MEKPARQRKPSLMEIPPTILDAVIGLLKPYLPGVTPESLAALEQEKLARIQKDDFFSREEAMETLHCGPTTLWRYEKQGRIRVFRPTKRKALVYRSSIERLMKEGSVD